MVRNPLIHDTTNQEQQNNIQQTQQQTIIVHSDNRDILQEVSNLGYKLDQLNNQQVGQPGVDVEQLVQLVSGLVANIKPAEQVNEDKCTLSKKSLATLIPNSKLFISKSDVVEEFEIFFSQLSSVQSLNILFKCHEDLIEIYDNRLSQMSDAGRGRKAKEKLQSHKNEIVDNVNVAVEGLKIKLTTAAKDIKIYASEEFTQLFNEAEKIFNGNETVIIEYCNVCKIDEEESVTLQYYSLCSAVLEFAQLSGENSEE